MKKILALLFAFSAFSYTFAQNNTALANQAIAAYDSANFEKSIGLFNQLLEQNPENDKVHYNLANAYYKNREIAQAILHYEKAIKLNPGFEDARHNLAMANSKTIDQIEAIPELFLYRWWKAIFSLFSADQWAMICVSLFLLAVLAFAGYFFPSRLFIRKLGFYTGISALFLGLFTWFMATQHASYLDRQDYAIIMEPTVSLNSSPSEGSSKLFVLHEGTKVRLESSSKDWYEISIPNGNKGWIKSEMIAGI